MRLQTTALGFFVVCALLSGLALWFLAVPFADTWLSTDEGLYAQQALRVLDGQVIYRDFFQPITPGYFVMLGGWIKIAGASVVSLRAFMILIILATSMCIYVASVSLGVSPAWALAPSIAFSVFKSRTNFELNHYAPNLLFEVATLALMSWHAARPSRMKLFGAGVLVSADVLTTQHVGAHLLLGVALALIFIATATRRGLWADLASLVAGGIPLTALYLVYAVVTGSLGAMVDQTFLWVFRTYTGFDTQDYWYHWVRSTWRRLLEHPSPVTVQDFVLGLVESYAAPVAVIVTIAWLVRARRAGAFNESMIPFGAAAIIAGSMYGSLYAAPNSLIPRVSLTGYVLAFALVHILYRSWREAYPRPSLQAVLSFPGLTALLLLTAVPVRAAKVAMNIMRLHRTEVYRTQATQRGVVRMPAKADSGELALLTYLARHVPSGDYVCAVNWSPWIYYLSGCRNPGRSEYLLPFFTSDEIVKDTMAALDRTRTQWIIQDTVIRRGMSHHDGRYQGFTSRTLDDWPFAAYRDTNFEPVATCGDFVIYHRRRVE